MYTKRSENCRSGIDFTKILPAVTVFSAILFCVGMITPHANAETINMYVQKMPPHWEADFGNVLSEAALYWEDKVPSLKFQTVDYVDKSDLVVQWASQYGEGKLGYYSDDIANEYGKPIMSVTLGFFKDKKWSLVSPEYVLEVTKHELGHAIGLPHSNDPNDIMYPTVEDYESWEQDQIKISTHTSTSTDWKTKSDKYQAVADEKIPSVESAVEQSEEMIIAASDNEAVQDSTLDDAMMAFWWAKKYLDSAQSLQVEGSEYAKESDYQNAYLSFRSACEYAKKAEEKAEIIAKQFENIGN